MNLSQIKNVETWDVGGGLQVDVLTMPNGQILVVSDDYVGLYENADKFFGDDWKCLSGFDLEYKGDAE